MHARTPNRGHWTRLRVRCQAKPTRRRRVSQTGDSSPTARTVRYPDETPRARGSADSIEERIVQLQDKKKLVVAGTLDGDTAAMTQLTAQVLCSTLARCPPLTAALKLSLLRGESQHQARGDCEASRPNALWPSMPSTTSRECCWCAWHFGRTCASSSRGKLKSATKLALPLVCCRHYLRQIFPKPNVIVFARRLALRLACLVTRFPSSSSSSFSGSCCCCPSCGTGLLSALLWTFHSTMSAHYHVFSFCDQQKPAWRVIASRTAAAPSSLPNRPSSLPTNAVTADASEVESW